MKRTIVFAIAAPVAVWAGIWLIGRKRADDAGTAVWMQRGFLIPTSHGLLVESMAAGALLAYLTS
jgi:hypothetical protein